MLFFISLKLPCGILVVRQLGMIFYQTVVAESSFLSRECIFIYLFQINLGTLRSLTWFPWIFERYTQIRSVSLLNLLVMHVNILIQLQKPNPGTGCREELWNSLCFLENFALVVCGWTQNLVLCRVECLHWRLCFCCICCWLIYKELERDLEQFDAKFSHVAIGTRTGPGIGNIDSNTVYLHVDQERCKSGLVSHSSHSWSLSGCSVKASILYTVSHFFCSSHSLRPGPIISSVWICHKSPSRIDFLGSDFRLRCTVYCRYMGNAGIVQYIVWLHNHTGSLYLIPKVDAPVSAGANYIVLFNRVLLLGTDVCLKLFAEYIIGRSFQK